ncbi:MAG: HAD hydrolase-like protein, partial [Candidatus Gastranaerophilales bacterium]|nr:HAD hydrolase-like protein [Candidatus Gastranaerophilales bacterium]
NGVEKKPNPIGVIRVIRELESEKSRCLYIGDSEVDIQTANNAGIQCVSVLWGYKTKLFLEENGGKYFAESPKDIINFL